jgi:hypothetical protein
MSLTKRGGVLMAVCATTLLALLGPAAARPIERDRFQDSGTEVINLCGLRIRESFQVSGSFVLKRQGRRQLAYAIQHVHGLVTRTNLANGKTLRETFNNVFKDQKIIINNGDGTLTILVMATGSNKIFGPDGKLLINDPGQIRFELLIDHGGTPADPSDDEFIRELGLVKGSTGRNDFEGLNFCQFVRASIG